MLRAASGWIWIALLLAAPWAYACLDDWAKAGLGAAGILAAILWAIHYIRIGRRPPVPRTCLVALGGLLVLGWWMAWNAHSVYTASTHQFAPVHSFLPAAPGAVDDFTAAEAMWPLTGILGLLLLVTDLARERAWRMRFAWTALLAGSSIALYGILEKRALLPHLTYQPGFPSSAFGPFDYHGNAGAFLNLILPLAWVLAFAPLRQPRPSSQVPRLLAAAAAALCIAGQLFNISRGSLLVCGLELACLLPWTFFAHRPTALTRRALLALLAGFLLLAGGGVLLALSLHRGSRSSLLHDYLQQDGGTGIADSGRVLAWKVAWGISTDAPWFGSGPGSFKLLFPDPRHWIPALYGRWVITRHVPGSRVSAWSYPCEDYLQTLVEWGWIGAALWAILVAGAAMLLLRRLISRTGPTPPDRPLFFAATLALAGIYLHAAFDYPLQIAALQLYVASFLGLAWSLGNTTHPSSPARP